MAVALLSYSPRHVRRAHHGLAGLNGLTPATRTVVVTAAEVSAGTRLDTDTVTLAEVPESLIPTGVITDRSEAMGHVVTAALPVGIPISTGVLLGEEFLSAAPPGRVVVPISIQADGTERVAIPGATVALYATPDNLADSKEAVEVTRDALVVGRGENVESGSIVTGEHTSTLQIYVAVEQNRANLVIGYGATALLRAVLIAPPSSSP